MIDEQEQAKAATQAVSRNTKNGVRKRSFFVLGIALATCALCGALWAHFAAKSVTTDNAYTAADVAQITPLVSGPVKRVNVTDTQAVHAGDILVVLDDTDAKIAVLQAEANLDRARRQVKQIMSDDVKFAGEVAQHDAEIRIAESAVIKAQADFEKASIDESRRGNLVDGGSVSRQEFTDSQTRLRDARATLEQAKANVLAARSALSATVGARQSSAALFEGHTVETNPVVVAAAAQLEQARVNLARTVICAPIDGVVTQRSVDIGQQVQAGTRLMTVVPVNQIYVDANFKETQLGRVEPGQHVRLTSDLYGANVVYSGQIVGFEGGTGSAMAVIPAQNATGNWIKVVQRLPVRIRLEPEQLARHPLRIGLSMDAKVELTTPSAITTATRE